MKFSDLDSTVEYALDAIEAAVFHTECLVEEHDGKWQELNDMLTKMTEVLITWREIIPPGVKEAIQGEYEYLEHLADLQDAQSF